MIRKTRTCLNNELIAINVSVEVRNALITALMGKSDLTSTIVFEKLKELSDKMAEDFNQFLKDMGIGEVTQ